MIGVRVATIVGAGVLALATGGPVAAGDAVGMWLTEGGKARVRVSPCGGALCGAIMALKEANDPETGRPKTDKHNADAGKRGRPIIGVHILLGMKPTDTPGKWAGQVYNAEDGKTYTGYVTLTGAESLKLEGCVLGGLICKAQTWTRSK
jgi:uncharacterized protein (DUF2147 family)